MSDQKSGQDQVLDHNYDGIQEYNNPLPGWWLATFYGTIIFAGVYLFYYEFGGGKSLRQEFEIEMTTVEVQKAAAPQQTEGEQDLAAVMSNPKNLEDGKATYTAKCAACHGQQGQGIVGPNLTDKYWINGIGTRQDILKVVRQGVPAKGMLAWETLLKPEEIVAVAGYVYSLRGSNPPNPKPPQGNETTQ
jgi:cytochrome c oxidase cbb3-type subunit 3